MGSRGRHQDNRVEIRGGIPSAPQTMTSSAGENTTDTITLDDLKQVVTLTPSEELLQPDLRVLSKRRISAHSIAKNGRLQNALKQLFSLVNSGGGKILTVRTTLGQAIEYQRRALILLARRGGGARMDGKALRLRDHEKFLQAQPETTNGEDDGKEKSEVSPPVADLGSDAQWASQERDVRSPQPDLIKRINQLEQFLLHFASGGQEGIKFDESEEVERLMEGRDKDELVHWERVDWKRFFSEEDTRLRAKLEVLRGLERYIKEVRASGCNLETWRQGRSERVVAAMIAGVNAKKENSGPTLEESRRNARDLEEGFAAAIRRGKQQRNTSTVAAGSEEGLKDGRGDKEVGEAKAEEKAKKVEEEAKGEEEKVEEEEEEQEKGQEQEQEADESGGRLGAIPCSFRPGEEEEFKKMEARMKVLKTYRHNWTTAPAEGAGSDMTNRRCREKEEEEEKVVEEKAKEEEEEEVNDADDFDARLWALARSFSAEEWEEFETNHLEAEKARAQIKVLQTYQQNGITSLAEGIKFDKARRRQEEGGGKADVNSCGVGYDLKDAVFDVEGAPGADHLAPLERVLCAQLHMLPRDFLVVKRSMVQDCVKAGCLKKGNIAGLSELGKPRQGKIYDFFSTTGWMSKHLNDYVANGDGANAKPGSRPT